MPTDDATTQAEAVRRVRQAQTFALDIPVLGRVRVPGRNNSPSMPSGWPMKSEKRSPAA